MRDEKRTNMRQDRVRTRKKNGSEPASTTPSKMRNPKRKWTPRPLCLPEEEVTWRPTGDWPDEVREYLIAYARTGNRSAACKLIGRSTDWAYTQQERYGDALTEQENAAYMSIAERIRGVATTQALEDPDMPGTTMRIFLLKGAYPDEFGERQKIEHSGRVETNWIDMISRPVTQETGTQEPDSSTD